ncbi:hypothetical protein B0T24DRAFT_198934 [Lasiosphaeria ovina]|uniref:Secreted protein n=1 Tax=Lasiosphaeria ovina TaxID=92902 RepID=A0AAE0TUX0_9PEZI|nr:hypothetical protein B0T24DRAFT_198934 [Lasiosphaeria ovina]
MHPFVWHRARTGILELVALALALALEVEKCTIFHRRLQYGTQAYPRHPGPQPRAALQGNHPEPLWAVYHDIITSALA